MSDIAGIVNGVTAKYAPAGSGQEPALVSLFEGMVFQNTGARPSGGSLFLGGADSSSTALADCIKNAVASGSVNSAAIVACKNTFTASLGIPAIPPSVPGMPPAMQSQTETMAQSLQTCLQQNVVSGANAGAPDPAAIKNCTNTFVTELHKVLPSAGTNAAGLTWTSNMTWPNPLPSGQAPAVYMSTSTLAAYKACLAAAGVTLNASEGTGVDQAKLAACRTQFLGTFDLSGLLGSTTNPLPSGGAGISSEHKAAIEAFRTCLTNAIGTAGQASSASPADTTKIMLCKDTLLTALGVPATQHNASALPHHAALDSFRTCLDLSGVAHMASSTNALDLSKLKTCQEEFLRSIKNSVGQNLQLPPIPTIPNAAGITNASSSAAEERIKMLQEKIQMLMQQIRDLQTTMGSTTTSIGNAVSVDVPPRPWNPVGLSFGSRGDNVSKLQAFLAKDPSVYPSGDVTGFFGPKTEEALKRWQAMKGIIADGSASTTGWGAVGPRTLEALLGAQNSGN